MPTKLVTFGVAANKTRALITFDEDWKAGDQPPEDHDYLGWHAWAAVQHKAGLRQVMCSQCCLWKFPQELSERKIESVAYRDKKMTKPVTVVSRACLKCDKN